MIVAALTRSVQTPTPGGLPELLIRAVPLPRAATAMPAAITVAAAMTARMDTVRAVTVPGLSTYKVGDKGEGLSVFIAFSWQCRVYDSSYPSVPGGISCQSVSHTPG